MHGDKIETARRAALAVLDRLEASDRVAAVIFDDRIDVLQTGAPATREVKARLRAELSAVAARGNTALHEGWLSGCRAIASEGADRPWRAVFCSPMVWPTSGCRTPNRSPRMPRASANTPEWAPAPSASAPTTTKALLGPMAVAGGGQFHNLRSPDEIARTFLGELGELLTVAAANVRLDQAVHLVRRAASDQTQRHPPSKPDRRTHAWSASSIRARAPHRRAQLPRFLP